MPTREDCSSSWTGPARARKRRSGRPQTACASADRTRRFVAAVDPATTSLLAPLSHMAEFQEGDEPCLLRIMSACSILPAVGTRLESALKSAETVRTPKLIFLIAASGLVVASQASAASSPYTNVFTGPTFGAPLFSSLHGAVSAADSNRKRRCRKHRCRETNLRGRDGKVPASTSVGGGFGLLAPWPAGKRLTIGRPCGNYYQRGPHRDFGARWGDDRFAVDIGLCGKRDFGTRILAAHDGAVRLAYDDSNYGKTVLIEEQEGGLATRYTHLDEIDVKRGDDVKGGEQIGTLGYSGAGATKRDSHLHLVAYAGRRARKGFRPSPMAGVRLCNGCTVTSLTQRARSSRTVRAALEAQYPFDASGRAVLAPGASADFGFDIKFDRPFEPANFVLRPRDRDLAVRFAGISAELVGFPSFSHADRGMFRGALSVPAGTQAGEYPLEWDVIDASTGRLANLRLDTTLIVKGLLAPAPLPCPPSANSVLPAQGISPTFRASLDAQFPMDAQGFVYATPGMTVPFGYNVRFNQPFSSDLVLRPNTTNTINHFVAQFGTPGNDFPGAVPPNDDHVGFFRANVTVPPCTPLGQYFVQWRAIKKSTGEWGGLEPSFVLNVVAQ